MDEELRGMLWLNTLKMDVISILGNKMTQRAKS